MLRVLLEVEWRCAGKKGSSSALKLQSTQSGVRLRALPFCASHQHMVLAYCKSLLFLENLRQTRAAILHRRINKNLQSYRVTSSQWIASNNSLDSFAGGSFLSEERLKRQILKFQHHPHTLHHMCESLVRSRAAIFNFQKIISITRSNFPFDYLYQKCDKSSESQKHVRLYLRYASRDSTLIIIMKPAEQTC